MAAAREVEGLTGAHLVARLDEMLWVVSSLRRKNPAVVYGLMLPWTWSGIRCSQMVVSSVVVVRSRMVLEGKLEKINRFPSAINRTDACSTAFENQSERGRCYSEIPSLVTPAKNACDTSAPKNVFRSE
jgi:hypothetical protein